MIDEQVLLPVPNPARITFSVVNLPIKRDLNCGPFVLSPVADIDKIVKRLKRPNAQSEITAGGTYLPPNPLPDDLWPTLGDEIRVLERLLTFAHRCRVHVVRPKLEEWSDGQWVSRGGPVYFFDHGHPSPRPWYAGQDELEGFLARNFKRFQDAEFTESTGIVLALAFYDQIFSDYVTELQYLKTWFCLEVLLSRHASASGLLRPPAFKNVRHRLEQALKVAVDDHLLKEEDRAAIKEKMGELNRLSAVRQGFSFLAKAFEKYPDQDVTEDELRAFVKVRNDIVHRGEMQSTTHELVRSLHGLPEGDLNARDYAHDLGREQRRLQSLFERVVLAMLGEHPQLMGVSWREYQLS